MACKDMKGADGGVHVALSMGDEKKQSAAATGAAPSWDDGGEGLLFTQSQTPTALTVELFAEGKKPELIGSVEVPVKDKGQPDAVWDDDAWHELAPAVKGKKDKGSGKAAAVGQIHLLLHWERPGNAQNDDDGGGGPAEKVSEGAGGGDDKSVPKLEDGSPDFEAMTPQQLKDECKRAGLSPDGLKEELVRRLHTAALVAEAEGGGDDADDLADLEALEDLEEGDPPQPSSSGGGRSNEKEGETTEGAIKAQMTLATTVPESVVARNALEADFIAEMAAKMGIDPSRIKVTAIVEDED